MNKIELIHPLRTLLFDPLLAGHQTRLDGLLRTRRPFLSTGLLPVQRHSAVYRPETELRQRGKLLRRIGRVELQRQCSQSVLGLVLPQGH